MHMVILAIEFDQLGIEISADACKDWPQIIQSLFRVANKTLLALLPDLAVLLVLSAVVRLAVLSL